MWGRMQIVDKDSTYVNRCHPYRSSYFSKMCGMCTCMQLCHFIDRNMASHYLSSDDATDTAFLLCSSIKSTPSSGMLSFPGTPPSSSHPSIDSSTKSSSRLSDNDRRKHLNTYNNLIKAGVNKNDAAAKVGYTLRSFQLWSSKFIRKWSGQKHKRNRKSHIHHIEVELLCFVKNEWFKDRRHPVKISVVIEKAKDFSDDFKRMHPSKQYNVVKYFMQRARKTLPPPPRKTTMANEKTKNVITSCRYDNCVQTCRRKDNCPHKRMVNKIFKRTKRVKRGRIGVGLITLEHCTKGDFIIEYFGKQVLANATRDDRGRHSYYMRVGKITIDGNIQNNMAKYINHSCDANCALEIKDDDGTPHACIIALKRIRSGSELTINYNWERKHDEPSTVCLCGSLNCNGIIEKLVK